MSQTKPSSASQSQAPGIVKISAAQGNPAVSDDWRGQRVCIKRAYNNNKKDNELLIQEVEIHRRLTDRHIIQFYDFDYVLVDEERQLGLIMELAEAGTLRRAIEEKHLLWCDKERIAGEIAHGLSYLHSLDIIHCDIKSSNVLLTRSFEVKICDFGSAMTSQDKGLWKRGTDGWMAPELSEDHASYSNASDIYSLGVVMWEMASSKAPTVRTNILEEKLEHVPYEYLRTMQDCCKDDPKLRPGAREVAVLKQGCTFKELQEMLERVFEGHEQLLHLNLSKLSQIVLGTAIGTERVDNASDGSSNSISLGYEFFTAFGTRCKNLLQLAAQHYLSQQFDLAFDCARRLALLEPGACFLLSQMYLMGDGVEMNHGEASRWEFLAASSGFGFARAQLLLGDGVEMNHGEASRWEFLAASSGFGFARAQLLLGEQFEFVGNYREAIRWTRKAAEQKCPESEHKLGLLYYQGRPGTLKKSSDAQGRPIVKYDFFCPGILANPSEGEKWFLRAANQGYIPAASSLGSIYLIQGKHSKAMEYFFKAVGDKVAEYHIGYCYRYGTGDIPQNHAAALEWFERSAEKQYCLAEWALGNMYDRGEGVTQNEDKAKEFLIRAHEHEDPEAANDLALISFYNNDLKSASQYLQEADKSGSLQMGNRIIINGTEGESESESEL